MEKQSQFAYKNAHPAAVDESNFAIVERLLKERQNEKGKRAPWRAPNDQYILSVLVCCGNCSYAMFGRMVWDRQDKTCPGCHKRRTIHLRPRNASYKCKCGHSFSIVEGTEADGRPYYVCDGGHRRGKDICRVRSVDEVELLHCIGSDIEAVLGKPEQWRDEVIATLRAASHADPAEIEAQRAALKRKDEELALASRRFLIAPAEHTADLAAALATLKAERQAIADHLAVLEEASEGVDAIEEVASKIVDHLRLMRCQLASGDSAKVEAVLQRLIECVSVVFDTSTDHLDKAPASIVKEIRIKYRPDAFTVKNLLPGCVSVLRGIAGS